MLRRNTKQRELVHQAVMDLRCHATADEVYEYIATHHPGVGKATVYRNLNLLSEEGAILKIAAADGPDRYDHQTHPHFHGVCKKCGRYYDVQMKTIPNILDDVQKEMQFAVDTFDIVFKGVCCSCNEEKMQ